MRHFQYVISIPSESALVVHGIFSGFLKNSAEIGIKSKVSNDLPLVFTNLKKLLGGLASNIHAKTSQDNVLTVINDIESNEDGENSICRIILHDASDENIISAIGHILIDTEVETLSKGELDAFDKLFFGE